MAINLQRNYPEDGSEYSHVLERSETEWLGEADVHEIFQNLPTASTGPVAPYETGIFLYSENCETDDKTWEEERLMTTADKRLYYKRYILNVENNSRYEKRVYKPHEFLDGLVVVHFRMVELPQDTSGEDTDNSYGPVVDFAYPMEYNDWDSDGDTFRESENLFQESESLNANDGNGNSQKDMVRPLLSKEIEELRLAKILSRRGSGEDVVEAIHSELMKIKEEMKNGKVALEKYVLTEALTKSPEAYPDSKSQPHVQVALRMRRLGYNEGFNAEDSVPYIICYEQGSTGSVSSAGIAERARHPDELKADDSRWLVDIDYYLAQQIHPVVSSVCAEIQGTSRERIAECLGLDPSKYRSRSDDATDSDLYTPLLLAISDEEERYKGCEPLALTCPSCSSSFNCTSVISSVCAWLSKKTETEESDSTFWLNLRCPKCEQGRITSGMIYEQVKLQMDRFKHILFEATMMCDDCQQTTRPPTRLMVDGRVREPVCPNYPICKGTPVRKYTEADLIKQLSYFCHILDTRCSFLKHKKIPGVRGRVYEALEKIKPTVFEGFFMAELSRDRLKGVRVYNDK